MASCLAKQIKNVLQISKKEAKKWPDEQRRTT